MIGIDIHKMPSKLRIFCHFSLFMSLISAKKYLIDIDSGEDEGNKGTGRIEDRTEDRTEDRGLPDNIGLV